MLGAGSAWSSAARMSTSLFTPPECSGGKLLIPDPLFPRFAVCTDPPYPPGFMELWMNHSVHAIGNAPLTRIPLVVAHDTMTFSLSSSAEGGIVAFGGDAAADLVRAVTLACLGGDACARARADVSILPWMVAQGSTLTQLLSAGVRGLDWRLSMEAVRSKEARYGTGGKAADDASTTPWCPVPVASTAKSPNDARFARTLVTQDVTLNDTLTELVDWGRKHRSEVVVILVREWTNILPTDSMLPGTSSTSSTGSTSSTSSTSNASSGATLASNAYDGLAAPTKECIRIMCTSLLLIDAKLGELIPPASLRLGSVSYSRFVKEYQYVVFVENSAVTWEALWEFDECSRASARLRSWVRTLSASTVAQSAPAYGPGQSLPRKLGGRAARHSSVGCAVAAWRYRSHQRHLYAAFLWGG